MTINGVGYFTLEGNEEGILTIVGTSSVTFATEIANAPSGKCYVTGNLINLTPQAFNIKIIGFNKEASIFNIPAYAGIKFTKMPMMELWVAVNGTIRLQALGFVVDPSLEEGNETSMLNTVSGIFVEEEKGRRVIYELNSHTDINTATTTTLINPTEGFTQRVRSINVTVAGACTVILQWTNADGSGGDMIFRDLNFTAGGTFVVDLGDIGQHNPNGVNGLLEAITNNTVVIDIDIMFRED